MPFQIVHNDIVRMHTDAIVNAANSRLLHGHGVCGAIFAAAGTDKLQEDCNRLAPCPVGEAVITSGYHLHAKYIIHTVGPIWDGGGKKEEALLKASYLNSLALAKENHCNSIAFPMISAGIYGYPKEQALDIMVEAVREFLNENEMDIYLVVFNRSMIVLKERLASQIKHSMEADAKLYEVEGKIERKENIIHGMAFYTLLLQIASTQGISLERLCQIANVSWKLREELIQGGLVPTRQLVYAIAIALHYTLEETKDLLKVMGFETENQSKMDVILRFFIEREEYDLYLINEVLFCYEEALLGS